jgi:hypothetical protein
MGNPYLTNDEDWIPRHPIRMPTYDMETVQTSYGPMARWKAKALAIGEMQRVLNDAERQVAALERNDDAHVEGANLERPSLSPSGEHPEKKYPPPLVADDETKPIMVPAEVVKRIDQLVARMDEWQREKEQQERVNQALLDAEDEVEAEMEARVAREKARRRGDENGEAGGGGEGEIEQGGGGGGGSGGEVAQEYGSDFQSAVEGVGGLVGGVVGGLLGQGTSQDA